MYTSSYATPECGNGKLVETFCKVSVMRDFRRQPQRRLRTALCWAITEYVVVILGFFTLGDGTDGLSRNARKELSLHVA
jgi:hypothetical protein